MKPTRGLFMDTRPQEQPEGTNPYGKNGIQYDLSGSVFNEPGFRKLAAVAPYKVIGIIETDTKPVIISTDNTNSAIGYFDPVNEVYIPVYDDRTWAITDGKFNFNTANYIRGQSQRNYRGELVIELTDKVVFPMYANMDRPELVKSMNDFRLFAYFIPPNISVAMGSGGILPGGAYYVAVGYERNDGTSTQYSQVSDVTLVTPGQLNTADKTLNITITNADQNYDLIRLAIISKVNGVTTAIELTDYLPVSSGTVEFSYTGEQLSSSISVSTILTPPALYARVKTIGQLNDYSYLGGLHAEPDLDDMQPYALLAKLEWVSQIETPAAPSQDLLLGVTKGFMHGEVYAFYIRYKKARGGMTKWFTMAGVAPRPQDLVNSTEVSDPVPKFKLEDCIPYYDPIGLTGGCGGWSNKTETYPVSPLYDASALGGENLSGAVVRHYKMPSLLFTKNNLYPLDTAFGVTNLDLLGIRALNVKIPDKYIGTITGYEIGYAIRTVGNRTIAGQAPLLYGAIDNNARGKATSAVPIYTTGGNFTTNIWHSSQNNALELQDLKPDTFRMHPFDLLFFKPAITPNYIAGLWKMRRNGLAADDAYIENSSPTGAPSGTYDTAPIEYIIDYTTGEKVIPNTSGKLFQKINKSFYAPNNINVEKVINSKAETVYTGYVDGTGWPVAYGNIGLDTTANSAKNVLQFEESYMANLISIKDDLFENFYSQQLASVGLPKALNDATPMFGGDTFVSAYTFHTYGRYNSIDAFGGITQGVKIARRIICESTANIALRYDIPGNQYSLAWPKAPLIKDENTNYLTLFDRSQDPNQFGYSKDYNAINDLIDSTVWVSFREYIYDFPYRIHRGGKASRQGRPRSWRTFLALDYYEMQKNMGLLINLEGMDDKLIIHMENAMFLTQDKAKLESGVLSITLGAGDIFQFEPQEALSSKLGYAGTQHDLACVRTPFGYVFIDAKMGEMFIYKNKLSLLNTGINTFLRDALKQTSINPYIGNGVTIGWDQKFKRIILTVKNKLLASGGTPKIFVDTPDFWNNLVIGDVVFYNGRLTTFMGLNNSIYNCIPDPIVHVTTWQPTDSFCMTGTTTTATILKATETGSQQVLNTGAGNKSQALVWSTLVGSQFSQDGFGHITYNGTDAVAATFTWKITGDRHSDTNGQWKVTMRRQHNAQSSYTFPSFPSPVVKWTWNGSVDVVMNPGDELDFLFEWISGTNQVVSVDNSSPGFTTFQIDSRTQTSNTGFKAYANRIRLIDGVPDGYTEPNDNNGIGIYFPPVQDLIACSTTPPVPTWYGTDGTCIKQTASSSCAMGYTLNPVSGMCEQTNTSAATPPTGGGGTPGIATGVQNEQWNNGGANLYLPGYPSDGQGTIDVVLQTAHLWVNGDIPYDFATRNLVDGRMNKAGIWVLGNTPVSGEWTPINEYIGFARKFVVPTAKTIYVGMSADNDFKFNLNGVTLVDTSPNHGDILGAANFGKWNIYPIHLVAGTNYVEMYAKNAGSVAGFAAEIYDMTRAQLLAATTEADLNIIFSTKDVDGQPFDLGVTTGYSCPAGWSLDTSVPGVYTCVQILSQAPTTTPGTGYTGVLHYNTRCRKLNNIPDGYCEPNSTDGSGQGPFVPDTMDQSCIQNPVTSGNSINIIGTIKLNCNDNGCVDLASTGLDFTFAQPTPYRMTLRFGQLFQGGGVTNMAVGYDIMPGGTIPMGYIAAIYFPTPNIPFAVDIPAGSSSFSVPSGIFQENFTSPSSEWICNSCQRPVSDIYVQVEQSSIQDTLNTYVADFTMVNPGITIHNV